MAQFSVNATRFDPYKNFKFRVKWDGRYVAGISKVGALKRTTEVVEHREGGDPSSSRKSPGRTKYDAITLERGVTHDTEFEKWANKVWNFGSGLGAEVSLKDFRKDIIIEVYNEAGQLVIAYKVYRCWVSEYQALPDLDANAGAVAIQHIKLENEGWERDVDVVEPSEPTVHRAGQLNAGRRDAHSSRPPTCSRSGSAARTRHALDRSALLCAWARPELPADTIADLPLGEVTTSLLRLREAQLRRAHPRARRLRALRRASRAGAARVRAAADRWPTSAARRRVPRPARARRHACATWPRSRGETRCRTRGAPTARALLRRRRRRCRWHCRMTALREVEDALEALDPNADLAFDVRCEACGHVRHARSSMPASCCGTRSMRAPARCSAKCICSRAPTAGPKREILALSATRRAAYLAMVAA